MKKLTLWGLVMLMMTSLFAACDDDSDKTTDSYSEAKAIEILSGEKVLYAKTTVNGADKTLLPAGAPAQITFAVAGTKDMVMLQKDFKLAGMPFAINYAIELEFAPLSSFETTDFPGDGWMKFYGTRGLVSLGKPTGDKYADDTVTEGDGSTVEGFVNILTKEIAFKIDFAIMNVISTGDIQPIDAVSDYAAAKAKYEEELAAYKKEHGLDTPADQPSATEIGQALKLLIGEKVLMGKTLQNGTDKTLLPGGAPCMYAFVKAGTKDIALTQKDFKIGNMPMGINYAIELSLKKLTDEEKKTYPADGWLRMEGVKGFMSPGKPTGDKYVDDTVTEGNGSTLKGFVNVLTGEITFNIDYNLMGYNNNVIPQGVNAIAPADFDTVKAKYEEELKKYKEENGL